MFRLKHVEVNFSDIERDSNIYVRDYETEKEARDAFGDLTQSWGNGDDIFISSNKFVYCDGKDLYMYEIEEVK